MQKFTGVLASFILLCGCSTHKPGPPKPAHTQTETNRPIVTLDYQRVGKVLQVNTEGRFVIINFPPGDLPKTEDRLNVYRNGLKVAEVKVDKWQGDNNTVADIVAGNLVQVGDEVRQN